ncbi:putative adhesin, partial [Streptomyces sp. NPDC057909]|uniref:putative adhesin n=1 Tax=Streptomyces sp. NPDC057909 TaxID=3346277 RepID=UPI0036E4062B
GAPATSHYTNGNSITFPLTLIATGYTALPAAVAEGPFAGAAVGPFGGKLDAQAAWSDGNWSWKFFYEELETENIGAVEVDALWLGRLDGDPLLVGHSEGVSRGSFIMPEGTWLNLYTEPGYQLSGEAGSAIMDGKLPKLGIRGTISPGEEFPSYLIDPPFDHSVPVSAMWPAESGTELGEMMTPNMGQCHLVICMGSKPYEGMPPISR